MYQSFSDKVGQLIFGGKLPIHLSALKVLVDILSVICLCGKGLVKKHNLGEVVNSFVPAEIAKGIIKTIYTEKSKDYNADFVQEHTVQAFQKTIKDTLLG